MIRLMNRKIRKLMKNSAVVMTGWCYHGSYGEQERDELNVALTGLAERQIMHCLERAHSRNNPRHDYAAHLSIRHTGLSHKGVHEDAHVYLLTLVTTERGVSLAPNQIVLYVGPFEWARETAALIQSELEQRALDNPPAELNSISFQ
jgi:hypothetical protein